MMKPLEKAQFISNWIKDYVEKMPCKAQSLVIGISVELTLQCQAP